MCMMELWHPGHIMEIDIQQLRQEAEDWSKVTEEDRQRAEVKKYLRSKYKKTSMQFI